MRRTLVVVVVIVIVALGHSEGSGSNLKTSASERESGCCTLALSLCLGGRDLLGFRPTGATVSGTAVCLVLSTKPANYTSSRNHDLSVVLFSLQLTQSPFSTSTGPLGSPLRARSTQPAALSLLPRRAPAQRGPAFAPHCTRLIQLPPLPPTYHRSSPQLLPTTATPTRPRKHISTAIPRVRIRPRTGEVQRMFFD